MLNQNSVNILQIVFMSMSTLMCSRYDYLLFENFELTRAMFLKENEIVKSLEEQRENFPRRIHFLQSELSNIRHLETYSTSKLVPIHKQEHANPRRVKKIYESKILNKQLHNSKVSYLMYFNSLHIREYLYSYDDLHNLTAEEITLASLKGVVMLKESYIQDIKNYSKGNIRWKSGIKSNSRQIDTLQPQDMAAMSSIAFNTFKWHDTGLKCLKGAIDMFYSLAKTDQIKLPRNLEDTLLKMKKYYPTFHNNVFRTRYNIIGPDWKVFPYAVNTGGKLTKDNISDNISPT